MINFNDIALRLYHQIFTAPAQQGLLADGIKTVLDANTAIAITEACLTEVIVIGGGFSEPQSSMAWLSEQQRVSCNLFEQKLQIQYADSPRGALATAMGVAMSGHRSSIFLNSQDLASCVDLLHLAIGRQLALVIHLDNQLLAKQGNNSGSGHEVLGQIKDTGCAVLFATNVQQAVDFSLIARQLAEISLTPVVVVMDGLETALSAQDVRLPSRELVIKFIGHGNDKIASPTIAQQQLFSTSRSRLHRWFDLDQPVLQGAMLTPDIAALAESAKAVYFDLSIAQQLKKTAADFEQLTARQYPPISQYALKKAEIIFIAQGSAVETLSSLSDYLQQVKKISGFKKVNIGVIGLQVLRPLDSQFLLSLLKKNVPLVVLDRCNVPLADDAPLIREIGAIIQKQRQQNNQSGNAYDLYSILYGLAGASLDLCDLIQLCQQLKADGHLKERYLGITFEHQNDSLASNSHSQQHPKQQARLDVLLRHYPQIKQLAINATHKPLSFFTQSTLSIAISYVQNRIENSGYSIDLAHFLYLLQDKKVRTYNSPRWQYYATRQTDYVVQSDAGYALADSALVDYFMLLDVDLESFYSACVRLNSKGCLLLGDSFLSAQLSAEQASKWLQCQQLIKQKNLSLYQVKPIETRLEQQQQSQALQWEKMLGLFSALLKEKQVLTLKTRKILSIRQKVISEHLSAIKIHSSNDQTSLGSEIFKHSMETVQRVDSQSLGVNSEHPTGEQKMPLIKTKLMQHFAQAEETYASLPRFMDQFEILQSEQKDSSLCADAFLASAIVPPLTASFNDLSQKQIRLQPLFDPLLCTACGACWANCPDSAIATVAISPKALIDTAISITSADALRPVAAKMASQIAKHYRTKSRTKSDEQLPVSQAGKLLDNAFAWLKEKAGLSSERMQAIEVDYHKAVKAIAELPIVSSDLFFYAPEKKENGSGELFSLVINPQTCKSCGLCIELCEPQALSNSLPDETYDPYHLWHLWQQTADTLSTTIERVKEQKLMPTGAALMLSRYHSFAMSGGDLAEPASAEKIALRQILSGVEYHQQPLLSRFISELDQLRNELKREINACLSIALPTDNLTHLSEKLSDLKTRQVDLNDLLDKSSQLMEGSAIDANRVRELVDYVIQLNELHYRLSIGTYGLGRSRYSLCIASSSISRWAGNFPDNPFHVPVSIDTSGASAQLATGLIQGQINDLLMAIALKRQAQAAITKHKKDLKLEQLEWSDLSDEEQQLCPPLLLVGDDKILAGQGLAQISLLLNSSYPIKIIIFSELDSTLVASTHIDSTNNLALMAMSQRNAYVAQSSIADNSHLQSCVEQMLHFNAPALIRLYAPSPTKHGFNTEQCLKQANLAVLTRMSPLFSYNPQHKGVFGSRLSLDGNQDLSSEWLNSDYLNSAYLNLDRANDVAEPITPANWAINEQRFKAHFSPCSNKIAFPVAITEWVNLSKKDQQKKTPYFVDQAKKIAISKKFATMISDQQKLWRTLQELAGLVTPFTEQLEKTISQRLATEHQQQVDELRKEYEAKIKQLEENYNSQTHTKIRNQLLGLAGYDINKLH